MLVDPIQMVGPVAELRGLRGCGCFSGHDAADAPCRVAGRAERAPRSPRGFRLVRTMYPPTSGHESTASRHAP